MRENKLGKSVKWPVHRSVWWSVNSSVSISVRSSVQIPVTNGDLNLGIWQGIYLCEHRNRGGARHLVLTLFGN